eukprot:gene26326-17421_t
MWVARVLCGAAYVLLLLLHLSTLPRFAAIEQDALRCGAYLDEYHSLHHKEAEPYKRGRFVHFLHVPRTAGRTFETCFMKPATPSAARCTKAYDHLRLNMSHPDCKLLSSHDDFSVVALLPPQTVVITHLRDPIDRFLSAYEFAVETATRLIDVMKGTIHRKRKAKTIATDDVWPWSYLSPFMANDIAQREINWEMEESQRSEVDSQGKWINVKHPDGSVYYYNKVLAKSKWNLSQEELQNLLPPLDPYDNALFMSLREFSRTAIAHELLHNGATYQCESSHLEIAHELLHNGATYQVLGITNYSHWGDAQAMRECVDAIPSMKQHMLDFAASFGFDLSANTYPEVKERPVGRFDMEVTHYDERDSPMLQENVKKAQAKLREVMDVANDAVKKADKEIDVLEIKRNVDAARLQVRQAMAQSRNAARRDSALARLVMPDGRAIQFDHASRQKIPQDIIDYIRSQNTMDTKLHEAAQQELASRTERLKAEGKLKKLPQLPATENYPASKPPKTGMKTESDFPFPKPEY